MRTTPFRRTRPQLALLALSFALLAVGACATTRQTAASTTAPSAGFTRASATKVSRQEIEQQDVATLFDALMRLRPEFLLSRNASASTPEGFRPLVYIDEMLFGDVTELKRVSLNRVLEVRLLSSFDARERFGKAYPGGVIAVRTR